MGALVDMYAPKVTGDVADASFAIGHRHRVCEDYAVAGRGLGGAFAIVSDGCSSSPQSDFGARLLSAAAARELALGTMSTSTVLGAAARAAKAVGLAASALDATLLCAYRAGEEVHVLASGDGVVAAVDDWGTIEAWAIRHPSGAPAYLSYQLDGERRAAYLRDHHHREVHELFGGQTARVVATSLFDSPYVWRMTLPASRFPVVAVLSDGAESFRGDEGAVPLARVLTRLLDFKVLRGEFVARRMRRFLTRECSDLGWRHDDDLAMAAIITRSTP